MNLSARLIFTVSIVLFFSFPRLSTAAQIEMEIEPRFEAAGLFYEGIAPVKLDGKWGFIKQDGSWAIEPRYFDLKAYRGGNIAFSDGVAWGYADKTGKIIVDARYPDVGVFSENRTALKNSSGMWAIADPSGVLISRFEFLTPPEFSEGKAAVQYENSAWGFVDAEGNFRAKGGIDRLFNLSEGRAAYIRNGKRGFVDAEGNSITGSPYKAVRAFSGGYAAVLKDFSGEWLWTLIDDQGKDVFGSEPYLGLRDFSGRVVPAQTSNEPLNWIYIDEHGYGLRGWEYGFEAAYSFREGFALVKKEGNFGFLNVLGKYASDDRFDDAFAFNEGMAPVMKGGKWGFVRGAKIDALDVAKMQAEKTEERAKSNKERKERIDKNELVSKLRAQLTDVITGGDYNNIDRDLVKKLAISVLEKDKNSEFAKIALLIAAFESEVDNGFGFDRSSWLNQVSLFFDLIILNKETDKNFESRLYKSNGELVKTVCGHSFFIYEQNDQLLSYIYRGPQSYAYASGLSKPDGTIVIAPGSIESSYAGEGKYLLRKHTGSMGSWDGTDIVTVDEQLKILKLDSSDPDAVKISDLLERNKTELAIRKFVENKTSQKPKYISLLIEKKYQQFESEIDKTKSSNPKDYEDAMVQFLIYLRAQTCAVYDIDFKEMLSRVVKKGHGKYLGSVQDNAIKAFIKKHSS